MVYAITVLIGALLLESVSGVITILCAVQDKEGRNISDVREV